ncbi:MAG: DUF2066 domain-containing protein [Aquimonas sp.]
MRACSIDDFRGLSVRLLVPFRHSLRLPGLLSALILWACCAPLVLAQAIDPAALYEGEAAVPDQSEEARSAALPEALARVLVKLTGSEDTPLQPAVREQLAGAAGLLQHFRYRSEVAVLNGLPEQRAVLVARFDRAQVDALLGGAGIAFWPGPRPPLMLWLGIDDGRGPRLVSEAQAQAVAALSARAANEGVGLIFPLLDLEDQAAVSAQAVWDENVAALVAGSARYASQSLLSGRLERAGSGWRANWLVIDGGDVLRRWSDAGGDAQALLANGASQAVAALTQRYAGLAALGEPGRYAVRIQGIQSGADYARVVAYLRSLSLVRGIEVRSAEDSVLVLMLDLGAGVEALQRLASFGQVLRPLGSSPGGAAEFQLEP